MATTVLVVEDEAKIRELLRSYLEREGFAVLSTESGAEAIELARTAKPDLLILDLGLPDVSGEAVVVEVRRFSAAPVLMLTAKSGEEDRIRGLELGADDYVTKPFSPREVVLRVQAILRRASTDTAGGAASVVRRRRNRDRRGSTPGRSARGARRIDPDRVGRSRGVDASAGTRVLTL